MMNIALIDRHPIFRTGIRAMLASRFEGITTLETGCMQALETSGLRNAFDVIIIGLSEEHPDIDRTVLRKTIKNNPLASFIVCASAPADELAGSLICMGVKGFVTKNSPPDDLVNCIRSVIAGKQYVCPEVAAA